MRTTSYFITALLLGMSQFALGQVNFNYSSHTMTISGTSTLHDWESDVTEMSANGSILFAEGNLSQITWLEVIIPVKSIISPKGSVMDNKTYEALKADEHPEIIFRLTKVNSITPSGGAFKVSATGFLTMAGYTKTVNLTVTAKVGSDGIIEFSGSKDLKMTNFNIDPPTAMLGAVKTADDITINFKLKMSGDYR